MNISLLLLKTGEYIISQVEELDYEPKVHLILPYLVSGKTKPTLSQWPLFSEDDHVLLNSDTLLTVCTPTPEIRNAYMKKVGITEEQLKASQKPVILNEEEVDQDWDHEDDGYEPRYVEQPV
jgi:hypothetical protein